MKFLTDLHTHTIVSGHAYSTLLENIEAAKKKGIKVLGDTEHGPTMPGASHLFYFGNLKVIPRVIDGVTILKGCEANILDYDGKIDMPETYLKKLDLVIASLHEPCIQSGSRDENTRALISVMDNPYVDIIGHCGNPNFPIWEEKVVKAAKEKNVLIEINNSSFVTSREGSKDNCFKIAKLCKEYNTRIVLNTDAHFAFSIGEFAEAEKIINDAGIDDKLVINTDETKIIKYLQEKGKIKDIILD